MGINMHRPSYCEMISSFDMWGLQSTKQYRLSHCTRFKPLSFSKHHTYCTYLSALSHPKQDQHLTPECHWKIARARNAMRVNLWTTVKSNAFWKNMCGIETGSEWVIVLHSEPFPRMSALFEETMFTSSYWVRKKENMTAHLLFINARRHRCTVFRSVFHSWLTLWCCSPASHCPSCEMNVDSGTLSWR